MLNKAELSKIALANVDKGYYCHCVINARDVADRLAEGKECTLTRCIVLLECNEQFNAIQQAKLYDCTFFNVGN